MMGDDWSEPATEPDANGNTNGKKTKKSAFSQQDDEDDLGLDDEDEEDDDDEHGMDDGVQKLGPSDRKPRYPGDASHAGLRYPTDDLTDAMGENRDDLQYPKTTDFETFTAHVKQRDGLTAMEAQTKARKENPELFRRSQGSTTTLTTKRAPSGRFESLVADEIRKGCSPTLAKQRVINLYGSTAGSPASSTMRKAESAQSRLQERAYELAADYPSWPMEKCLREARLEQPHLHSLMNIR
jgi:hypothetical protein